jgi:hypothetical protein
MDLEYYSDILELKRGGDVQPPKTKKYFRATKSGAGMTKAKEVVTFNHQKQKNILEQQNLVQA